MQTEGDRCVPHTQHVNEEKTMALGIARTQTDTDDKDRAHDVHGTALMHLFNEVSLSPP